MEMPDCNHVLRGYLVWQSAMMSSSFYRIKVKLFS